jgi:hypothetical protein
VKHAALAPIRQNSGMQRSTYWAAGRVIAAVGLIAVVLSTCGGADDDKRGSGSTPTSAQAAALAAAQSGQPFAEPPRVASVDGVLHFDLVASDRGITVGGSPCTAARTTTAWSGRHSS